MFEANIRENRTREVIIKDFTPDIVKGILQYIYTGDTDEDVLKEKPGEFLDAAEKYQMTNLKEIFEFQLCSILEVGNSVTRSVIFRTRNDDFTVQESLTSLTL